MAKSPEQRQAARNLRRSVGLRRFAARAAAALAILLVTGSLITLSWYVYRANTKTPNAPASVDNMQPSNVPIPPDQLDPGFLPVTAEDARSINARRLIASEPVELAAPFRLPPDSATAVNRMSALECLTAAVYYEAASESAQGQRAVAQVVLNRMRHPAYPKSVCGVVYQGSERTTGCQFSFTCDGSLARRPSQAGWLRARGTALAALSGLVEPSVGTATHYHADYVVPRWAGSLDKIVTIGAHIFYRWKGFWGKRRAFTGVYAGERELALGDVPSLVGIDLAPSLAAPVDPLANLKSTSPIADQVSRSLVPRDFVVLGAGGQPHLDNGRGTLTADENSGALIAPGPGDLVGQPRTD